MNDEEIVRQIQEAAQTLKDTIETYLGERVMVNWAALRNPETDNEKVFSGIVCSDNATTMDIALMNLKLSGRLYGMNEY